MKRLYHAILSIVIIVTVLSASIACAQELKPITLPAPQTEGGMPLMQALKERMTSREFSPRELPPQMLSNLLWAAFGINRPDGRRTAPTASNRQEIEIYVAMSEGLYLYNARDHMLQPVLAQDIRALTGTQDFVRDAPVNLVYVADFSKMGSKSSDADKRATASADTGFIGQNVYLFCASEGLATVVRGMVDKPALEKAMGLRPDQKVILAHTVGYPK